MKKLLILLIGFLASLSILAQQGQFAPLNPDFVRYQESLKTPEGKKSAADGRFVYVPSPLKLNFANYKGVSSLQTKKGMSAPLPSRFDLRDSGFVTPVKNQGFFYTCWAFAAMSAIESNWLINHWGTFDLSEQNICACNGVQVSYDGGGVHLVSSAYLTRLAGPVLETDDPYKGRAACKGNQLPVPRYVLTSRILPNDPELIKRTIMKYGGVNCYMMAGFINNRTNTGFDFDKANYNPVDYTFYYAGTNSPDHIVCITGWDDEKIVTGGDKSPKGTKGAWIVKNSLGPEWGENGYFYLSYYDNMAPIPLFHFDESADTTEIDEINMYDDHGASKSFGYKNEVAFGLTRFNADEKEIIIKVGTYIISAASSIDIEIYKEFTDGKLSGLLYSKKEVFCEFPGQRVFDVFVVVEGEYYIKIKYNTPTCIYPIPVEAFIIQDFGNPEISTAGTNWVSNDGETWEEIGAGIKDRGMDLTIRSYTKSPDNCFGFFELPEKQICFGEPLEVTAELSDSTYKCYWQFLPDGVPLNDSGPGPVVTQFASPGVKKINLIIRSQNSTDTVNQNIEIVSELDIKIIYPYKVLMEYYGPDQHEVPRAELGNSINLSVHADADSFQWNYPYNIINKSEISVSPEHIGENLFYVTAYQGTCKGSDTISVEGYGGLFRASEDTLVLESDSGSLARVIIEADTSWFAGTSSTNKKWLGFLPENCQKIDTITVFSISANHTGKIRKGYISINGPLMKPKIINVKQDFDPSAGIDMLTESKTVLLYPNPASAVLFIKGMDARQLSACTLTICDITGRIVKKPQIKSGGKIDVSGLSKGLYFLEVREDQGRIAVLRFMKE
jgi:C1A family cysteine protease